MTKHTPEALSPKAIDQLTRISIKKNDRETLISLLQEIEAKSLLPQYNFPDNYHVVNNQHMAQLLDRRLSKTERRVWATYYQRAKKDKNRQLKDQVNQPILKKEKIRPKTRKDFPLLNLSDEQLLQNIIIFYIQNREGDKKGRDNLNQLQMGVKFYSNNELQKIVQQVGGINKKTIIAVTENLNSRLQNLNLDKHDTAQIVSNAIKDVIYASECRTLRKKESKSLTRFNDNQLKAELVQLHNGTQNRNFDKFFQKILFYRLSDLKNQKTIKNLRNRINKLPITFRFNKNLKNHTLDIVDLYLIRNNPTSLIDMHDNELKKEFSLLHKTEINRDWYQSFLKTLTDKLQNIENRNTIIEFRNKINKLRFNQNAKQHALDIIDLYLIENNPTSLIDMNNIELKNTLATLYRIQTNRDWKAISSKTLIAELQKFNVNYQINTSIILTLGNRILKLKTDGKFTQEAKKHTLNIIQSTNIQKLRPRRR